VTSKASANPVTPPSAKPVVKAAALAPKKPEPKAVAKPTPVTQPKAGEHQPGTKSADTIRKPAASGATPVHKSFVSTEPSKKTTPIAAPSAKPFQKMIEKKEIKPFVSSTPDEPQKSRYSDSELVEFDQLIDEKLIVAREQLEFYLKQLEDMAENPDNKIKSLDDGLSSLESERVSSMASRQQKLIQHLENAKIRIKNKVYGICRETGKLISKERLRAVPHATLSIEAKQAQN
jgi:RNA polymerase-binding transcription factor DksA